MLRIYALGALIYNLYIDFLIKKDINNRNKC
jgi:hypothetical protein